MLQPVGPLDDAVYWRRRAVALGAAVLLVALLVWGLASLLGGGTDAVAAPEPVPSPEVSPVASGLATPPGVPAGVLAPPAGTALGPTIPGAAAPPSGLPTMAAAPAPATPSAAAARPGRCSDTVLTVIARTDAPTYRAGATPVLSLVIINHGPVPCVRDLDAARQAVAVVRTPGDGLWASNDCSPGHTDDVRTLVPGQEVVFSVRWAGRTSLPGCSAARRVVPSGSYQVLARLDRIVSTGVRFALDR